METSEWLDKPWFEVPSDVILEWLEIMAATEITHFGRSLVEIWPTPKAENHFCFTVNGHGHEEDTLAAATQKAYQAHVARFNKMKEERRKSYEILKAEFEGGANGR